MMNVGLGDTVKLEEAGAIQSRRMSCPRKHSEPWLQTQRTSFNDSNLLVLLLL